MNLLFNAIKFSERHMFIKIDVSINQLNHLSDHQLVIKVEDNGIGIKREDLKNIFKPFFKSETITLHQNLE